VNDKEPLASPDDSRETVANLSERTIATPHFDHTALRQARPAIPINASRGNRFWPMALIAVALAAGLAGGVIGAFIATGYLSRSTTTSEIAISNDAPVNTEVVERDDAPPAEDSKQQTAPEQISEAAEQSHSTERKDETLASSTKEDDEGRDSSGATQAEPDVALRAALNEWIAATNARDINKQMGFYNRTVSAFYQARDVNQEIVRADKARAFERAHSINVRAGTPQISFSPDGQTAIMRFRKQYNIAGGGEDRSGEVVQELRWRRVNGKWRIVSERDVRIVR
jgi:ketosteroid isomerase-like protein